MNLRHSILVALVLMTGATTLVSCKGRRSDNVEPTGDTVEVVIERNSSTTEKIIQTDTVTVPAAADTSAVAPDSAGIPSM